MMMNIRFFQFAGINRLRNQAMAFQYVYDIVTETAFAKIGFTVIPDIFLCFFGIGMANDEHLRQVYRLFSDPYHFGFEK